MTASAPPKELRGIALVTLVGVLSMANFLAFLDSTIANVLVPHISGSLATTPSNGTWVITGYAVAEAIMVPLTSWLISRFGGVRMFITCILGFGIFSMLCGMATTMPMLIAFRVCLGICGGPLIPISQTLLLKIVPQRRMNLSLTIWSMGSIMAPILGPVFSGLIGDNMYWGWAFYSQVPLALIVALIAWRTLTPHETQIKKINIDYIGLGLLVLWVGALQIMLGNGQDMDWFHSDFIVTLLIVTLIGFVCFVIWEFTDKQPIVDLRIFRNRTFAVSMVAIGTAFGTMFCTIVLLPLWLQEAMGYTSTWAGYNSAMAGITMMIAAPVGMKLIERYDTRGVIFTGLLLTAASNLMRVTYTDQITFEQLMWPQLVFGAGMVLTLVPLVEMSTASLPEKDIANGTSQFNFVRTLSCAIATAIVVAGWNDQIKSCKDQLVGVLHDPVAVMHTLQNHGLNVEQSRHLLDKVVLGQGVMQATNNTFLALGIISILVAGIIWLAPKPPKKAPGKISTGH